MQGRIYPDRRGIYPHMGEEFISTWGDLSLQERDLTSQGGSSQQKQLPIQGGDLHLQVGFILTGGDLK